MLVRSFFLNKIILKSDCIKNIPEYSSPSYFVKSINITYIIWIKYIITLVLLIPFTFNFIFNLKQTKNKLVLVDLVSLLYSLIVYHPLCFTCNNI